MALEIPPNAERDGKKLQIFYELLAGLALETVMGQRQVIEDAASSGEEQSS